MSEESFSSQRYTPAAPAVDGRLMEMISRAVAHDLKSPLGGLIGIIDLLKEDCEAKSLSFDQVGEYVEMMRQSSERLLAIVDSLVLLTKLGFTDEIETEYIDLASILRNACERVAPELSDRRGEIRVPERCPEAVGAVVWLEEIVVNLLSNALKYGGTPPAVVVEAARIEGGLVKVTVTDNGPGIPDDQKVAIFDQQSRGRRIKVDGLGLGLPCAKQIAIALGGDLGVADSTCGGSCFWITLPASQ